MNRERKAVLKSPHSKRWRECRARSNLAKRLECLRLQRRFSDFGPGQWCEPCDCFTGSIAGWNGCGAG